MKSTDYSNSAFPELTQKVIGLQNDIAGAFIGAEDGEGFALEDIGIPYSSNSFWGIVSKVFCN